MNPPPPPPHGTHTDYPDGYPRYPNGLPGGPYDIFIIPPHMSGGGFLYLPSLQCHRNSFLAGVATTLLAVAISAIVYPVLQQWFKTVVASGGTGVIFLMVGVGIVGWAWGKTQLEAGGPGQAGPGGTSGTYPHGSAGGSAGTFPSTPGGASGTYPNGSATGGPAPSTPGGVPPPPSTPGAPGGTRPQFTPKSSWQRTNTGPTNFSGAAGTGTAKGGWEKAREETRKKEEDRRKAEEARKKREDEEKEKTKQREKDAREREAREVRERREKEAKEKAAEKAADPLPSPRKPTDSSTSSPRKPTPSRPASPTKKHQQPTAHTATEDDAFSFRPYDKPKRPAPSASSTYFASSYAPSASTARTTPPPSHRRGPYATKDPDKIVLQAVYSFTHAAGRPPLAQLVSGAGPVSDGLVLRITTEGLFIDDDVRGVPQREWDVKAWTMKLLEVGCPRVGVGPAAAARSAAAASAGRSAFFSARAPAVAPSAEDTDAFLAALRAGCAGRCSSLPPPSSSSSSTHSATVSPSSSASCQGRSNARAPQSGAAQGLHVLRASIRDQEGKRYVFVLQEAEAWKVAVGLQRLRRGTQVRALGVSGMAAGETRGILEGMGWA
ncbi:hypothetical protein MMC13_006933 [Lambiella insularis]|nr:hypothetical protein [Lambiella insularis]